MFLHRIKHYFFDFQKNAILPWEKRAFFMPNRIIFFQNAAIFFLFLIFSRNIGSSSGEFHIV